MSYELEKNIKQVFKDNPNPELEQLFQLYQERYEEELACKKAMEIQECKIEHRKLQRIDELMDSGFKVTDARNRSESELYSKRLEVIHMEYDYRKKQMEKKVYRNLIEYLMGYNP